LQLFVVYIRIYLIPIRTA